MPTRSRWIRVGFAFIWLLILGWLSWAWYITSIPGLRGEVGSHGELPAGIRAALIIPPRAQTLRVRELLKLFELESNAIVYFVPIGQKPRPATLEEKQQFLGTASRPFGWFLPWTNGFVSIRTDRGVIQSRLSASPWRNSISLETNGESIRTRLPLETRIAMRQNCRTGCEFFGLGNIEVAASADFISIEGKEGLEQEIVFDDREAAMQFAERSAGFLNPARRTMILADGTRATEEVISSSVTKSEENNLLKIGGDRFSWYIRSQSNRTYLFSKKESAMFLQYELSTPALPTQPCLSRALFVMQLKKPIGSSMSGDGIFLTVRNNSVDICTI